MPGLPQRVWRGDRPCDGARRDARGLIDRGTPDLCITHARKDKTWGEGLTVGDGMLGLSTLVHRRPGNLASAATVRYTLFLKLQLKHRDAQPGWLEKR